MHRVTWDTSRRLQTLLTRLSRSLAQLSRRLSSSFIYHIKVPQPRKDKSFRFRLFRFRSPLLTESLRFLFLGLLRCFTSPRVAMGPYEFRSHYPLNGWVAPFGILRVKACLQLAVAYRSLPRPSSPVDTKAFTACPY